jgi:hypothetical protein
MPPFPNVKKKPAGAEFGGFSVPVTAWSLAAKMEHTAIVFKLQPNTN